MAWGVHDFVEIAGARYHDPLLDDAVISRSPPLHKSTKISWGPPPGSYHNTPKQVCKHKHIGYIVKYMNIGRLKSWYKEKMYCHAKRGTENSFIFTRKRLKLMH